MKCLKITGIENENTAYLHIDKQFILPYQDGASETVSYA